MVKNLKFKIKLLVFPLFFLIAVLMTYGVIQFSISQTSSVLEKIEYGYFPYVQICNELQVKQKEIQRGLQDGVAAHDQEKLGETKITAQTFNHLIDSAKNNTITVKIKSLDTLKQTFNEYFEFALSTSSAMIDSGFTDDITANIGVMVKKFNTVKDLLNRITDKAKTDMSSELYAVSDKNKSSANIIAIVLAFCFFFYLFIYFLISRVVSQSMGEMVKKLLLLSNGVLGITFSEEYLSRKDEIGAMMKALKLLTEKLTSVTTSVHENIASVVTSNRQTSSSAQTISQDANELASSSEEMSTSMEQMAAGVQQTSENANRTQLIYTKVVAEIEKVNDIVAITVKSMNKIADEITIINKIADRTDLLALNAAVEAARAGEAGKGFSVVASNVRDLAIQSQKAANKITEITFASLKNAEEASEHIEKLLPDVRQTTELISEIYASSTEQNGSVSMVSQAASQLSSLSQKSSAISEELAANSEQMLDKAEELIHTFKFFKVGLKDRQENINEIRNRINELQETLESLENNTDEDYYNAANREGDFEDEGKDDLTEIMKRDSEKGDLF